MITSRPLLTIFTAPKPFRGQTRKAQERAVESWLRLGPDCEVLLMGHEDGMQDAANALGVRCVPHVRKNEFGTPLIDSIFREAAAAARGQFLCYVNTDIILTHDFLRAVRSVPFERFLMVGQRWDLDPEHVPDPSAPDWEAQLRAQVAEHGSLHLLDAMDYFVFTPGLWPNIPPFALGRLIWDNWLVYAARAQSAAVIDATADVLVVHQNHDYSHHLAGKAGTTLEDVWKGPEAKRNLALAGGRERAFYATDSNWVLQGNVVQRRPLTLERLHRHFQTFPVLHPQWSVPVGMVRGLWRLRHTPNNVMKLVRGWQIPSSL